MIASLPRPGAIIPELEPCREALLACSQPRDNTHEQVVQHIAKVGMPTHAPLVILPYEAPVLERAVAAMQELEWQDPGGAYRIDGVRQGIGGEGMSVLGGFYTALLDVAVVFDKRDQAAADVGPNIAQARYMDVVGHELVHSMFARHNKVAVARSDDQIVLSGAFNLGQSEAEIELRPTEPMRTGLPVWLNEAIAVYDAARIRVAVHPQSVPRSQIYIDAEEVHRFILGVHSDITIQPHYRLAEPYHLERSSWVAGVLAGVGLELLDDKRPGTVDQIHAVAAGELPIKDFHTSLRRGIGRELYLDMVEPQDYDTWGPTYDQIAAL